MSSPRITERRRSRRRKPAHLVYLEFGRENGGMVKDVSEDGMRFHLINPVAVGQSLHFAVNIDATRRLEGQASMVWTDAGGKSGGMSFSDISAESRETLLAWLAEIDSPLSADPVAPSRLAPVPVTPEPIAPVPPAPGPVASSPDASPVASPPISPIPVAPAPVPPRVMSPVSTEIPVEASARAAANLSSEISTESFEASRPVTREDWIRAARENVVPGERTIRPLAAMMIATGAATAAEEKVQLVLPPTHQELKPAEGTKFEKIAERVDPLREFLRQPFDDNAFAHAPVEEDGATLDEPPRNRWSTSRVVMVLALAAICGAAAAFAAIAYRQTVGESIIELGEKISGEPRSHAGGDPDQRLAEPSPAVNSPTDSTSPETKRPAGSGDGNSNASPLSPTTQPASPPRTAPITQTHPQSLPQSPIPQTELAAGREIVPGKTKRSPEDVASLWLAVQNGDATAEVQLANRYLTGDGVEKNCDQGRVLLQAAAKRGNELATKRLAEIADTGCQ
jgi:PilZ domain